MSGVEFPYIFISAFRILVELAKIRKRYKAARKRRKKKVLQWEKGRLYSINWKFSSMEHRKRALERQTLYVIYLHFNEPQRKKWSAFFAIYIWYCKNDDRERVSECKKCNELIRFVIRIQLLNCFGLLLRLLVSVCVCSNSANTLYFNAPYKC